MLNTTNILALVGGGKNPKFSINKIIIWDDQPAKNRDNIIGELRFNSQILNVKIKMDRLIGVCQTKIYIFNLNTLETIDMFETFDNINGIVGFSPGELISVLAFPYESQGHVFLGDITKKCEKISVIPAHDSRIACIAINKDGTLLATASDKGTLIRIFTTNDGQKFSEFRRGTKNVEMNCLSFDMNNKFIGCSSNVGTIHIFSIAALTKNLDEKNNKNNIQDEPKNSKSLLGKIGGFLNIKNAYLDSERNFAKFKVQQQYSLIGFGSENTFVVITMDGKYYKAAYDPKRGGDCVKIEEKNYLVDI